MAFSHHHKCLYEMPQRYYLSKIAKLKQKTNIYLIRGIAVHEDGNSGDTMPNYLQLTLKKILGKINVDMPLTLNILSFRTSIKTLP